MFKPSLFIVVPSMLAAQLLGCRGDQPANAPDNPAPVASSQATTTGPAAASDTGSSGPDAGMSNNAPAPTATPPASAPADAPTALSDEQILQITHTANQGEIEQAKLAESKSKDGRVKKLAAMMLKDHGAADAKGMAVAKKANLTPAPSPTSSSLESDAKSATTSLASQTGADFDKGYVDTQVKEHQAVLDMIDQKLLPNAKSAEVKAFLTEVRPKIAMHLQHAQDLQTALQKPVPGKLSVSGSN
jgi:putative membrane protein